MRFDELENLDRFIYCFSFQGFSLDGRSCRVSTSTAGLARPREPLDNIRRKLEISGCIPMHQRPFGPTLKPPQLHYRKLSNLVTLQYQPRPVVPEKQSLLELRNRPSGERDHCPMAQRPLERNFKAKYYDAIRELLPRHDLDLLRSSASVMGPRGRSHDR